MRGVGGGIGQSAPIREAPAGARMATISCDTASAARAVSYAFVLGLVFWALVLFAIAIGTTFAYKLIGSKWDKRTLGYTADSAVQGYTDNGMRLWAGIADITPQRGGSDIEVVVKPLLPPIFYPTQPAQANLAQGGGKITHCEVRLDPVHFMALNEAARAATVTHELGHCLGLDHSDVPSVMMNPFFYAFGADDIAGAQALYGAAKPAPASIAQVAPEPSPTAPPAPVAPVATPAPAVASAPAPKPTPESVAAAAAPAATQPPALDRGWNLVTWAGAASPASDCGCAAVYRAGKAGWTRWMITDPGYLGSLSTLEPGVTYWMLRN